MNSDIESEIKLLVDGDPSTELERWLVANCELMLSDSKHLRNTYFDTPSGDLHKLKIGLRIRYGEDTGAEQTIKTGGRVVGGLHQREEYNLPVNGERPQLAGFPTHIWQESQDIKQLEKDLIPLFTTDFDRRRWLVAITSPADQQAENAQTVIEVVFDCGEIRAGDKIEQINELELELKQGEVEKLSSFAKQLATVLTVRPGELSKAARGYRLAQR